MVVVGKSAPVAESTIGRTPDTAAILGLPLGSGVAATIVRENADVKGRRYLTEGRLTVTTRKQHQVLAVCRGDGIIHELGWTPDRGWWCTCPALTAACSHLTALRLVVVIHG